KALGKRVKLFNTDFHEVVGVVADTRSSIGSGSPPILFRPLAQVYQSNVALLVRAENAGTVVGTVRKQIQQLDPRLPVTDASALAAARLVATLLCGSAMDPATFVIVPAILSAAVLAASYLPARRATRIPPTTALRSDA